MDFNNNNNNQNSNNNPYGSNGYPNPNENSGGYPGGVPYRSPVRVPGSSFASIAMVFGIISIVTALMMTVYFPFILGSLAILFAILSKGLANGFMKQAKIGIICGIAGLAVNIVIVAGSFAYILSHPDTLRQTARMYDNMCEQMYGTPSEEIFGDSMEDMVDNLIDQIK